MARHLFQNKTGDKIKIRQGDRNNFYWVTLKVDDFIELEYDHGIRLGLKDCNEIVEEEQAQKIVVEPEIEINVEVEEELEKDAEAEKKKAKEEKASKVEEVKKDLLAAKEKVSERLNKLKETVMELKKAEDDMENKVKHNRRKEDKVKNSAEKDKYMKRLLNIKGIGPKTAEDIVTTYETFDDLIKAIKDGKLQFRDDVSALLIDMFG